MTDLLLFVGELSACKSFANECRHIVVRRLVAESGATLRQESVLGKLGGDAFENEFFAGLARVIAH